MIGSMEGGCPYSLIFRKKMMRGNLEVQSDLIDLWWKKKAAPLRKERDQRAAELKAMRRGSRNQQKVARLLMNARSKLAQLPHFGRFQAILRSDNSVDKFLTWAERQGWTLVRDRRAFGYRNGCVNEV